MRRHAAAGIVLFLTVATARPVLACLWDRDTLLDEKRGLPGMAEILSGKWERHSRFFYEHRVSLPMPSSSSRRSCSPPPPCR